MPLPVSDFDFQLPHELIAQVPIEPRDSSRLLVVDRKRQSFSDRHFFELPEILNPGDLLVLNNTKVIQARLHLTRQTGGKVELLFLRKLRESVWLALARPSRRLKDNESLEILDLEGMPSGRYARILGRRGTELVVEVEDTLETLTRFGKVPLPPYIEDQEIVRSRYQTVFSSEDGSAAAPTAGLHFTRQLIEECQNADILFSMVTLHIGLDTFQPVRTSDAQQHVIHSEWYSVPRSTRMLIEKVRKRGGKVVGVGTTAVRVLETIASAPDDKVASEGWTSLFIIPPYDFQLTDGMITNFHLPRTTLLMMVTALAGRDLLFGAYRHAINQRYRFYSFGDAMLIV